MTFLRQSKTKIQSKKTTAKQIAAMVFHSVLFKPRKLLIISYLIRCLSFGSRFDPLYVFPVSKNEYRGNQGID